MKEATGNNDGEICMFHRSLNLRCGLAWCAIFGKYNYVKFDIPTKMDARAASIKNDPRAKGEVIGGSYWYPTGQGSGHTGIIYSWDKNESNKFIGIDGNWSNKVSFVQRKRDRHAHYISNPFPEKTTKNIRVEREINKSENKHKFVEPILNEEVSYDSEPKTQSNMEYVITGVVLFIMGIIMVIIGKVKDQDDGAF